MTATDLDIDTLRGWIGRHETATDILSAEHARAICATFDREPLDEGAALPPLWHWAFFRPAALARDIGADGHPRLGGFLPPVPLPRRMWVGSEIRFDGALRIGQAVQRRTTIADVTARTGRSGALVFLTLDHAIGTDDGPAIRERQRIVYRAPSPVPALVTAADPAPASASLPAADWRDPLTPDPVLLFRYSALTFNAHRIHYDHAYATGAEGYPGLVVHGPLTATLLMNALLARTGAPPRRFAFDARQPLFCGRPMAVCGRAAAGGFDLWAETPGGQPAMTASAGF